MQKATGRFIIGDPVHRLLDFGAVRKDTALVKVLLDDPAFQRLRRISQLGLAAHVFPGATHTRFSHCLGAAYLSLRVMQQLRTAHPARVDLLDQRVVMTAALLHDIGHGPFSHSFERAMRCFRAIEHEEWTVHIVKHYLQKKLRKGGVNPDVIATMLSKDSASGDTPKFLKQVVSSQLDVDRMDYLVRDAHFAGVAMGQIDVEYLIHRLTIVDHGKNVSTLGLTSKGVRAFEAFALARHLMNRSVYYHPTVATIEFMMEELLRLAVKDAADGGRSFPYLPEYLRRIATSKSHDVTDFMKSALSDYLDLTEDQIWTMTAGAASGRVGRGRDLAKRLLSRNVLPHFKVRRGQTQNVKEVLANEHFQSGIDFALIPLESTLYKEKGGDSVFFVRDEHQPKEITEESFALTAYNNRPELDTVLVVVDPAKETAIRKAVTQCISRAVAQTTRATSDVNDRAQSTPGGSAGSRSGRGSAGAAAKRPKRPHVRRRRAARQ